MDNLKNEVQLSGVSMRSVLIHLRHFALASLLAFLAEAMLFVAFVASTTSFGALLPVVWFVIRVYSFPAQIWGRDFDSPLGVHWLILPLVWGSVAYAITVFIRKVASQQ